jgi:hypothetical protein
MTTTPDPVVIDDGLLQRQLLQSILSVLQNISDKQTLIIAAVNSPAFLGQTHIDSAVINFKGGVLK